MYIYLLDYSEWYFNFIGVIYYVNKFCGKHYLESQEFKTCSQIYKHKIRCIFLNTFY